MTQSLAGRPPQRKEIAIGLNFASVIAASAEGYPFPTNLDTDPPVGGLASESQAELLARGLTEDLSIEEFEKALFKNSARRKP